jgi:hypothetical protein
MPMFESNGKLAEGYAILQQVDIATTAGHCDTLHTKISEAQSLFEALERKLVEIRVAQLDAFSAAIAAERQMKQVTGLLGAAFGEAPDPEASKVISDAGILQRAVRTIRMNCIGVDTVSHDAQTALNRVGESINESYPTPDTRICDGAQLASETYPRVVQGLGSFIEELDI